MPQTQTTLEERFLDADAAASESAEDRERVIKRALDASGVSQELAALVWLVADSGGTLTATYKQLRGDEPHPRIGRRQVIRLQDRQLSEMVAKAERHGLVKRVGAESDSRRSGIRGPNRYLLDLESVRRLASPPPNGTPFPSGGFRSTSGGFRSTSGGFRSTSGGFRSTSFEDSLVSLPLEDLQEKEFPGPGPDPGPGPERSDLLSWEGKRAVRLARGLRVLSLPAGDTADGVFRPVQVAWIAACAKLTRSVVGRNLETGEPLDLKAGDATAISAWFRRQLSAECPVWDDSAEFLLVSVALAIGTWERWERETPHREKRNWQSDPKLLRNPVGGWVAACRRWRLPKGHSYDEASADCLQSFAARYAESAMRAVGALRGRDAGWLVDADSCSTRPVRVGKAVMREGGLVLIDTEG